jgi:phosphoribosylformimino-5-aminoimidazole carboxamide ribotide isomerase
MEIIPAIDIRGGKCVRLYQGDYSQQTVFDENPAAVALKWHSQGANWLHVVDLDGAAVGKLRNLAAVEEIMKTGDLLVELGGGIRQERVAVKLLQKGVSRIILGTAAIENPGLVEKLSRRFGDAVVVGLDARDGRITVHGWQKDTVIDVLQLCRQMAGLGVSRFIYTDVKRDGTLTEPNFDTIKRLIAEVDVPIIASGGISRLEHLRRLKELGVEGAIIGKALYTGDINLEEAIASICHGDER